MTPLPQCKWLALTLVGFQKRNQFIHAKVGEDFAIPVHGGGFGLPGEFAHLVHGGRIAGDDDLFIGELVGVEVLQDFLAPGATGLDVEFGDDHG